MARLGQLLVRADLVTENAVARALGVQHFAGGRLGTLLLERGSIDEDNLGKTLALQHGCEYIAWRLLSDVPPVVIAALPAKFAIKHAAIPYERGENYLKLALRDPGDLRILDELFFVTGRKIIAGVAPEVRIYQALEKYYGERRIPRYVILADKLSRSSRASRGVASAPPPPPEFFSESRRDPAPSPTAHEVWGDSDQDAAEPRIIQSWKVPDQQIGGWAGTVSPGMDSPRQTDPETITWEEMPAIPTLWIPDRSSASVQPSPPETAAAVADPEVSAPTATPLAGAAQETTSAPEAPAGAPDIPAGAPEDTVPAGAPSPVTDPTPIQEAPAAVSPELIAPSRSLAEATSAKQLPAAEFPEFAAAIDRDSIATAALAALARRFERGAVFIAKPQAITAWGGAGSGVSADELAQLAIPWDEPSVFLNVRLSRSFYLGPLPPLPRHEAVAIAMGGWPEECLIQPILIKEKPVAFLYAEFTQNHGATPMDLAYMRELALKASTAFVSAIRLKKKEI